MKKREKIILVLAILALLYGAFNYFILSPETDKTLQSETENQFSDFLEKTNMTLVRLNILEQKKTNADYLVSMIESEWKNDPFSRVGKTLNKNQKSAVDIKMAGLIYSGFIILGNKMLAVIDGMEYTTGEYIKDSGYKIIRITPESVFINNNLNKKIVLYLKEG